MDQYLTNLLHETVVDVNGLPEEQQKIIDLICLLSSDENWEVGANFLSNVLESCKTTEQAHKLQNSTAFFICSRAIEEFLKTPITTRAVTQPESKKVVVFLMKWLRAYISFPLELFPINLIKRKLAQYSCLTIIRYYPNPCAYIFEDILHIFSQLNVHKLGPPLSKSSIEISALTDIFIEILLELDSYILNRDVQLLAEEIEKANLIKDTLRSTSLPIITSTLMKLMKIMDFNESKDSELAIGCLKILGLYASWIDINLVVNEEIFSILHSIIQHHNPKTLRSVCMFLKGLTSKGMAAFPDKLSLILGIWSESLHQIMLTPLVAKALSSTHLLNHSELAKFEDDQTEPIVDLLQEFSLLIGSIGYNLTEIYRSLVSSDLNNSTNTVNTSIFPQTNSVNSQTWNSAMDQCIEKLEVTFDIAITLFAYPDNDVSQGVLLFIGDYLSLLKDNALSVSQKSEDNVNKCRIATKNGVAGPTTENIFHLTPARMYKLERLMRVLLDKIKYPDDTSAEEMEEFEEDRHEYISIVRNIVRINGSLVLNAIHSLLTHLLSQTIALKPKNEQATEHLIGLEACLYLFYSIGEFYKAPRNDHFSSSYAHSSKMNEIMTDVCSSNVSCFEFMPIQLMYFEIIGRYEKFFNTSPKLLLDVVAAFLDNRGLRNPLTKVRCRCAYLFSRIVKSHKNILAPHAEQILRQLEPLLPIDPTPEQPLNKVINANSKPKPVNSDQQQKFLSISEQSFLYESSANLILARSQANDETLNSQTSQLCAMLLQPILNQFPELIRLLAEERDAELAESRGAVVKQAADLITRTTRVMSSQSPPNPGFIPIFMEILNVMIGSLVFLPVNPGSPGRSAACAGIRAFLHRLIGSIGPDCKSDKTENADASEASKWLLLAISTAMPQFIDVHENPPSSNEVDLDQRWRELREHMPLFSQVAYRYKEHCLPLLTACLPKLILTSLKALSHVLNESQQVAIEEQKLLRRSLLQLLNNISQVLPQGILVAVNSDAANILMSIVPLTGSCLENDDPVGMKAGFAFFSNIVSVCAQDDSFYEAFVLTHLVPLCFLSPARQEFRLSDAQFVLALNEAANCIHSINSIKGAAFQDFLKHTFLPQQNLSSNYIESYVTSLSSNSLAEFQQFSKNFYSSFR